MNNQQVVNAMNDFDPMEFSNSSFDKISRLLYCGYHLPPHRRSSILGGWYSYNSYWFSWFKRKWKPITLLKFIVGKFRADLGSGTILSSR